LGEQDYHMTPEEFRRRGREVVDWIADYMERVEGLPVRAQVAPGALLEALPDTPPARGEPFEAVLADLDRLIVPGLTHWQSPNFFAYFPSNRSGPSILGELLSAGLGVQGMMWSTSPACTELEMVALDWLVEMLSLPDAWRSDGPGGGVIQDTASSATLCAILAARERATGGASNRDGVQGGQLIAYSSSQAHSSIQKALRIAGVGDANLRLIPVDGALAMEPAALAAALAEDREAGRVPFFCCATVGTTSTLAVDPVAAIGEICERAGVWLHVDAAMAGTAALCPEHRHLQAGLGRADSYLFNPHKWMFTNFDCNCFWVADRAALVGALGILPEYLKNAATASGEVIDYRDWQVPLGRRFRALKLWMVIRHYGVEGLRHHVRQHVAMAARLRGLVAAHPDFQEVAPNPLNLVCFRHVGGDAVNQAIMDRVNASGAMFLSHTRVGGALVLRLAIGQADTTWAHVEAAWARLVAATEQEVA